MMRKELFTKKLYIGMGSILVLMLLVASFQDEAIAHALYDPDHLFGRILAGYGQVPLSACLIVSARLFWSLRNDRPKCQTMLFMIAAILLETISFCIMAIDPFINMKPISIFYTTLISILLLVGINVLAIYALEGVSITNRKKLLWLLLGSVVLSLLSVNCLKVIWGRPRMRLIMTNPDAFFQPWWVINSAQKQTLLQLGVVSEELKSFPSGHSANAALSMLLAVLPLVHAKFHGKYPYLLGAGIVFTFLVAFSRMIVGAHFLSDITIGITITFVIEMVLIKLIWVDTHEL